MLAEGNLQQNKGLTQHRVVSFPLTNEFYYQMLWKKKKKSACQLWLYYVFPELIMGKLWKFFFFSLLCVCVCVLANNNSNKNENHNLSFLSEIYIFFFRRWSN